MGRAEGRFRQHSKTSTHFIEPVSHQYRKVYGYVGRIRKYKKSRNTGTGHPPTPSCVNWCGAILSILPMSRTSPHVSAGSARFHRTGPIDIEAERERKRRHRRFYRMRGHLPFIAPNIDRKPMLLAPIRYFGMEIDGPVDAFATRPITTPCKYGLSSPDARFVELSAL